MKDLTNSAVVSLNLPSANFAESVKQTTAASQTKIRDVCIIDGP